MSRGDGEWDESGTTSSRHNDSDIASASADDYDENTEQLRADIEDTRAEMSQTINEIQERLSPEHLMGQVKETVREATIGKVEKVMDKVGETISEVAEPAREMAGRAGTVIKDAGTSVGYSLWRNPIPVALIGLGLGMLWMRRPRGNGYDMTTRTPRVRTNLMNEMEETPSWQRSQSLQSSRRQAQGSTTGTMQQVKETASDLAARSTDALSNLGTKAKDRASAVSTRFGQVLRDNPLAVSAVAVAAGTAVGLVLPSTQFENEYIGETSEMLVDKVEDVAREALDKVQDAARQMAPGTQPTA